MKPQRIEPAPGQESVWDYPRPPKIDPVTRHIQIYFNKILIADTKRPIRILETSHPPVFYIPLDDTLREHLHRTARRTFCEFKGQAAYLDVSVGDQAAKNAAWYYPTPTSGYAALVDHVAFYPSRMDSCFVDGEQVRAQDGDFYGGWITNEIVGPFKGAADTWGW